MTEATAALTCPACAEPIGEGDVFCEACGHPLRGAPPEVTTADEDACPNCGAPAGERDPDGYCQRCGHLRPRGTEHVEIDAGTVAAVSDKGHRHRRNEDAVAVRTGNGHTVLVVCDGVSRSANPDRASADAAAAVADHLSAALAGDPAAALDTVASLLTAAVAAGRAAVLAVPAVEPGGYPDAPSSTLVAAVVRTDGLAVANVGDSRAYWVEGSEARQLSVDDSLAAEAIARGTSPEDAYAAPDAHTITRWLGPDSVDAGPHIATVTPQGPGRLLVCSDGLWNYAETPDALQALVNGGPQGETAIEACRRLVRVALDAGGADNVSVAIALVAPTHSTATHTEE